MSRNKPVPKKRSVFGGYVEDEVFRSQFTEGGFTQSLKESMIMFKIRSL